MEIKEVNSKVLFLAELFRQLKSLQKDKANKLEKATNDFNSKEFELEQAKRQIEKDRNREINDISFLKEVITITKKNYNIIRIYLWLIFIFFTFILIHNFYNNGISIGLYNVTILLIIIISYYSAKDIKEQIYKISGIRTTSDINNFKTPFYYSIFKKPSVNETYKLESKKRTDSINLKYNQKNEEFEKKSKSILLELNNFIHHLNIELDNYIYNLYTSNKENIINFKNDLNKIHQTASSIEDLYDANKKLNFSNTFHSQNYIFSHKENFVINSEVIEFPNYIKFGSTGNLIIETNGQSILKVKDIINDIVLKQLMGIKLSKLKLILYDPIDLGAFFSNFHTLNKDLTGGMIYNSLDDLNEILDSTLRHIAMVVQKLLQNKYRDLDDYNNQNSELAESYKLLILNDFPKSFDDQQLKKLEQIMNSGPKCGIYTILIGVPVLNFISNELVSKLDINEFEPIFKDVDVNNLNDEINEGINKSSNIVVEIDNILLNENSWWMDDSSASIELPLGKRGKDTMSLKFDNKDDNQALMIGKPGSGKSNLLHVIILSAITKYGPKDLEIYLIDFKGGVEFMSYAEYNIPHIRTIALESDREFGLSVIDGVEKELLIRETQFRNAGVQNIEQYNQKYPEKKVPRILFIVDEFQEFFSIDDEIHNEVSLKYDRIIRKGRAFGINSLFSSQTLHGKSIPSSTKELIDIRIALMCGDMDIREIMDDKNLAAKDLTRPGEVIYNAENGKSIGNQRFQAVFVERARINEIIISVSSKVYENPNTKDKFIFRGDLKAFINKQNHPINFIDVYKYKVVRFWIGEPISMDPDFYADFKPSNCQNVFAIGNDIEASKVISSIMFSFIRQIEKIDKVLVCNPLTEVDDGYENFQTAYGKSNIIINTKPSNLEKTIEELYENLIKRKENGEINKSTFFILNSMQKLNKLRSENDISNINFKLISLLDEGPEFGIFLICHFDSLKSMHRTEIKPRFFTHRIAFEMNEEAYYELFGNSRIKQLKNNRIIYYNDETGRTNIIKPYELNQN